MMTALQSVSSPLILVPAYGKTYATKEAMLADWQKGIDFRVVGDGYASIRDIEALRQQSSTVNLCEPRNNLHVRV